jgi:translocator protein
MEEVMMNTSVSRQPRTFPWWYAVIIFVVANAISILPAGYNGDEVFYNNFVQPTIAPPAWLFAPMWLFLNITSVIALWMVANSQAFTARHRLFIVLEFIGWVLFAIFNTLYFWMQSPILGAIDTALALVVSLISLAICWTIHRRAALLILLRVLWLLLATYVSVYVAFNNVDTFFAR